MPPLRCATDHVEDVDEKNEKNEENEKNEKKQRPRRAKFHTPRFPFAERSPAEDLDFFFGKEIIVPEDVDENE